MMTSEARAAFDKLVELGAEPIDWGADNASDENHIAFGISSQVTKLGKSLFVDPSGEDIVEVMINGEWHNPGGVRQDVHEILRQHHLVSDWYNSAILCIYNDPYAPGCNHDDTFSVHHIGCIARGIHERSKEPKKGHTHDDVRRLTFEKCESLQDTHPNHPIYWKPLSLDEKHARIREAVPEGSYMGKFDELDFKYQQFRRWRRVE
ncbi:hypothetical protein [Rhodopirellula baltica]|uniref:Uncharacterized protein n=1 Tax=Rhodopirellula baltica SWK14 TaxID=993516 RepID=L7CAV7_RHOBT|nr:hypothetical protein [Rhodopirellula baltica]ELP30241.1 hypothetical protein RBSWK_05839 [Rhodopirellula baltica SWK14]